MEQMKLKKCSVKLNRLSFMGVNPDEIQEQILDQRIRKCSVRLRRCNEAQVMHQRSTATPTGGHHMRRCFIRLPRLNLVRSEISSPADSVVSGSILSDAEDLDNSTNRTSDWIQNSGTW